MFIVFKGMAITAQRFFRLVFTMTLNTRQVFTIMQVVMGILPSVLTTAGCLFCQFIDIVALKAGTI
ncbi:hypothetical protein AYI74_13755 [Shewanella algae]|nr:hypothetical protein AYI86_06220 [Shewanella algae]TWU64419.1 hypothetical protein AYI74_13755 [Shewanella algae]